MDFISLKSHHINWHNEVSRVTKSRSHSLFLIIKKNYELIKNGKAGPSQNWDGSKIDNRQYQLIYLILAIKFRTLPHALG